MRNAVVAALGAVLWATPGAAQLPHLLPAGSPWIDVNYPKLFWTPTDGLTGGIYLALVRPLALDQAEGAPPYAGAISLNGQASTSGSRELLVEGRFPTLVDGWRFVLTLHTDRAARANYFGLGNATRYDEALVTGAQPHFYRALASRLLARGEIQRRIVGGLRALAGFHAERARIAPLPGPSVLAADQATAVDPTIGVATADITVRGGLVFDTRDDEPAPSRGVLLEALRTVTAGGDLDYARTTVSAAGYLGIGPERDLVLSARVLGQSMSGTPRIGALGLIEASDRPATGLGGPLSHRSLVENRFLGRDKLLFSVDARYHVVNLPRAARATVIGFVDAGRVFQGPGQTFRLTTDDLKTGAGAGLFIQIGRAGIVGATAGLGPDGVVLGFATRWAY